MSTTDTCYDLYRPFHPRTWTPDDIERLRRLAQTHTVVQMIEMGAFPGRNENQIRMSGHRHGIKFLRGNPHHGKWEDIPPDEIERRAAEIRDGWARLGIVR